MSALEKKLFWNMLHFCNVFLKPFRRIKINMDKNNLEIAVLNSISKTVVHERNIPNLLKTVLDILHREMGLLRGTFTLMHESGRAHV